MKLIFSDYEYQIKEFTYTINNISEDGDQYLEKSVSCTFLEAINIDEIALIIEKNFKGNFSIETKNKKYYFENYSFNTLKSYQSLDREEYIIDFYENREKGV